MNKVINVMLFVIKHINKFCTGGKKDVLLLIILKFVLT